MTTFIAMPNDDGDDTILPCDTAEQSAEAAIALRDAGIASAPIWHGEAPDTVQTSLVLFAAKPDADKYSHLTSDEVSKAYADGNDSGSGFAPSDEVDCDEHASVEEAVAAYVAYVEDGGREVLAYEHDDQVAVLVDGNGKLIAIGGEAGGQNAWAVDITSQI